MLACRDLRVGPSKLKSLKMTSIVVEIRHSSDLVPVLVVVSGNSQLFSSNFCPVLSFPLLHLDALAPAVAKKKVSYVLQDSTGPKRGSLNVGA